MSFVETLMKPLIDDAYQKGFSAGVSAEKVREKKELTDIERSLYEYGYKMGVADTKAECGIVEIPAEEFDELTKTNIPEGPFGFVGTMDDMSLVLEEA